MQWADKMGGGKEIGGFSNILFSSLCLCNLLLKFKVADVYNSHYLATSVAHTVPFLPLRYAEITRCQLFEHGMHADFIWLANGRKCLVF